MNAQSSDAAAGFILAAIGDCQDTIRALDVKAEILAAFVGLLAGGAIALTPAAAALADDSTCSEVAASILGTATLVICALAIVAIGLVVYPRTAPAVPLGTYKPAGSFFPQVAMGAADVTTLAASASTADWTSELSFELLKLSAIRKAKALYFKGALLLTGAGSLLFAVAVIAQRV